MIHAYDKLYVEKAQAALARMLDFAIYDLGYDIEEFFDMFLSSGIADRFGRGDFTIIAGKSGVEITYEVLESNNVLLERMKPQYTMNRSAEYWAGWAIAYYQWATGLSFRDITTAISIKEILALYMPYHEMDIHQFVDKLNEIYAARKENANLKTLRIKAGLSQRQLAEQSGVPLRTIQQYEQRQKNINKAQVEYLVRLSQVLCCKITDLIERI